MLTVIFLLCLLLEKISSDVVVVGGGTSVGSDALNGLGTGVNLTRCQDLFFDGVDLKFVTPDYLYSYSIQTKLIAGVTSLTSIGTSYGISKYLGGGFLLTTNSRLYSCSSTSCTVSSHTFTNARGVWYDVSGYTFVADVGGNKIYKSVLDSLSLQVFAGTGIDRNGTINSIVDGSDAASTDLRNPYEIWGDGQGSIFFTDTLLRGVLAVNDGKLFVIAGGGTLLNPTAAVSGESIRFNNPSRITGDDQGNLFVTDNKQMFVLFRSVSYGETFSYRGNVVLTHSEIITGLAVLGNVVYYTDDTVNGKIYSRVWNVPTAMPTVMPTVIPSKLPTATPTIKLPTVNPTRLPTAIPTKNPTRDPSGLPTKVPTVQPTIVPIVVPTMKPSCTPSEIPTRSPTFEPTIQPTKVPSVMPTMRPSFTPTVVPTRSPSNLPTVVPTRDPSMTPSRVPTRTPSMKPSRVPTMQPSRKPSTFRPTRSPTSSKPSKTPTRSPTRFPTFTRSAVPTRTPVVGSTDDPSVAPSESPSDFPSSFPSVEPTQAPPSDEPTFSPTESPTETSPSEEPTFSPTEDPSESPSVSPSMEPTYAPTEAPSETPSYEATAVPSMEPSEQPTSDPTVEPTYSPTEVPSETPSQLPTYEPTAVPSMEPSEQPTSDPTTEPAYSPTEVPSETPSQLPTYEPTPVPSMEPSEQPTAVPTTEPSVMSSCLPTNIPSRTSSELPTDNPTWVPTERPSEVPSGGPSHSPSTEPSEGPTTEPTLVPSGSPTGIPTVSPTEGPSSEPTIAPTVGPTGGPSVQPSVDPTDRPSGQPSLTPTPSPSESPSALPIPVPSEKPSTLPTAFPSENPSFAPSALPSEEPAVNPTAVPTESPSITPTVTPSEEPSQIPSVTPSGVPSTSPTQVPSLLPSVTPSESPTEKPTAGPSNEPTVFPSVVPTDSPTTESPSREPTLIPSSAVPSELPTMKPSEIPSETPNVNPTRTPTVTPTITPTTSSPTATPSEAVVPNFISAAFTNEGSSIIFKFDMTTNQGKLSNSFSCNKLFDFRCASQSVCQWIDSKTISGSVNGAEGCVVPGDTVMLVRNNNITFSCSGSNCVSNGVNAFPKSLVIQAPVSPVIPTITIRMPSSLGQCSSLLLDLSGSLGSGGREWRNVSVRASSSSSSSGSVDTIALNRFLTRNFTISPPTAIPAVYFTAGLSYSFQVSLCNFLGRCAHGTASVVVTQTLLPTVTIDGSAVRNILISQPIALSSTAFVANCNGNPSSLGINYVWKVMNSDLQVISSVSSTSRDPSRFTLPAFSFAANRVYKIQVSASFNQQVSSASVQINTLSGALVAVIQGSGNQVVRIGSSLSLDGSKSYDQDQNNVFGISAGLSFTWTCTQLSPVVSASCSDGIEPISGLEKILVKPLLTATGASLQFTLTVNDQTGQRTASRTAIVRILPLLSTSISLRSNSVQNVINPDQSLTVLGTVSIPASLKCVLNWSTDSSITGLDLTKAVLTPLFSLVPSSTDGLNIPINLKLFPNVLLGGFTYSFTLTSRLESPGVGSSLTVTVLVNSPPKLGSFIISPTEGEELTTLFSFSCLVGRMITYHCNISSVISLPRETN
jgi:hypothetical protein